MARYQPNLDSVTTIAEDGSRNFLHPADVKGNFTRARRLFALVLVSIYFALPFIPINGNPAVFLDVINRRFHLFGLTFAAQDFFLTFFFISGLGFTLFFITSLFGRLWCGWACPHSVFLEQVFRRLERLFEGPAIHQRKLDTMAWTKPEKLVRRGGKLAVFLLISAVIAHFFLAYFISIPQLWSWIGQGPLAHPQAFAFVTIATGIIFFNFSWFREQLCLIICPYGRLQSALVDDDTMVIGYDEQRGEPRGKSNKEPEKYGDCINCYRCVQVCPTGIDIRQGLQIECIGCANCIDACNEVMDGLDRQRGLIRYDSLNGLRGQKRKLLRPRLFIYCLLLFCGAAAFTFAFSTIRPMNLQAIRMQGRPYYLAEQNSQIRNQYQVRVINKQKTPVDLDVRIDAPIQALNASGFIGSITLEPESEAVRTLIATLPVEEWAGEFRIRIDVEGTTKAGKTFNMSEAVEFVGPDPRALQQLRDSSAPPADNS